MADAQRLRAAVAQMLEQLDQADRATVLRAMELLQPLMLAPGRCGEGDGGA